MPMKVVKRLVIVGAVLLVLIVAGGFGVLFYLDSIAKAAIEKGGTYAFGVNTTLGDADVGLRKGGLYLKQLDVNNPAGYKSASFLTMDSGGIEVALGTLQKDVVEVPRLNISHLTINLEKADGKANYQVILDNLKKLESGQQTPPKESGGKKFIINEVHIHDVKVHVDLLPVGGALTQADITLDAVYLKDVGSAGKGVPLPELASIIVKALMSAIANKGAGIIPADLLTDLQGRLAQLKDLEALGIITTTNLNELATKRIGEVKKDVEKKLDETRKEVEKKIEDGLKDLLPGGKKK
jgi:hypothetical protein